MSRYPSDVAFSKAVKEVQSARGSRAAYARVEQGGGFETEVTDELRAFLAEVDSAFLATASADGQPYVQHRGGPRGFIRARPDGTLGFVDHAGNRQYVSTGNLSENDRYCLLAIDYASRRRIKIWGEARVVEDDPALLASLMPAGYDARPEQAIVIHVTAWDENCPQHIPRKVDVSG